MLALLSFMHKGRRPAAPFRAKRSSPLRDVVTAGDLSESRDDTDVVQPCGEKMDVRTSHHA